MEKKNKTKANQQNNHYQQNQQLKQQMHEVGISGIINRLQWRTVLVGSCYISGRQMKTCWHPLHCPASKELIFSDATWGNGGRASPKVCEKEKANNLVQIILKSS